MSSYALVCPLIEYTLPNWNTNEILLAYYLQAQQIQFFWDMLIHITIY